MANELDRGVEAKFEPELEDARQDLENKMMSIARDD